MDLCLDSLQLASGHLAATLILFEDVADRLTFVQRAEARTFDGRNVHKNVVAAVIGLNEAEALLAVKPLNGSSRHSRHLQGIE